MRPFRPIGKGQGATSLVSANDDQSQPSRVGIRDQKAVILHSTDRFLEQADPLPIARRQRFARRVIGLRQLRGEGMVQLEPHRGHVVLPLTRQDIEDMFWLQATIARELAAAATGHITDAEIDELDRINDALAAAVGSSEPTTIAGIEFAFHRVFNQACGRIKLAWFLLNAARYMPAEVYAADPEWGAATVGHHRELIAALRRRDAHAAIEHTVWQFTDAAHRLTEMLDRAGIFD